MNDAMPYGFVHAETPLLDEVNTVLSFVDILTEIVEEQIPDAVLPETETP